MTDLRCDHKLHGKLISPTVLEVACQSRLCGKEPGVVVLHQFDVLTGKLLSTKLFKNPPVLGKGESNGS